MKRLLIAAAFLLIGCEQDGADLDLNLSPDSLSVGDTAYVAGKIETTSDIDQDDIVVTFTDSSDDYCSYFTLLERDSVDSDEIYLDKNNYVLGFVVDSGAPLGDYNAHVLVQVGGESPSAAVPFVVVEKEVSTAQ